MSDLSTAANRFSASTFTSLKDFQCQFSWAIIIGFQLSFLLGFGMGANDVGNAFGTSVGSGAITKKQAYILASIMETLGAVLVGYNVVDTLKSKVVDLKMYEHTPNELLLGQVASLGGCTAWLFLAQYLKMPVSSSHSIVGAIIGFSLLMRGTAGIHISTVLEIAASWVISPALSGLVSAAIYMIVDFSVLRRRNPLTCGLKVLPIFYFFCFAFNTFMVVYQGSKVIGLSNLPPWMSIVISISVGSISAIIFQLFVRPRVITWVKKNDSTANPVVAGMEEIRVEVNNVGLQPMNDKFSDGLSLDGRIIIAGKQQYVIKESDTEEKQQQHRLALDHLPSLELGSIDNDLKKKIEISSTVKMPNPRKQSFIMTPRGFVNWFIPRSDREEDQQTLRLFRTIQVFTGCFAGFAHGAMDVSHTIAPVVALMAVYQHGNAEHHGETPLWLMFYGVSGTCVGFWAYGKRVMNTIGKNMTELNPCCGFTMEFGAALTVLVASKLGVPISTTHCMVGSVVAVGTIKSGKGVDWALFRNIVLTWLMTVPVSALFSAGIMFVFRICFL